VTDAVLQLLHVEAENRKRHFSQENAAHDTARKGK
jgi:hypothetical protein